MEQHKKNQMAMEYDNYWNFMAINQEEYALESLHKAADLGHPDAAKMLIKIYEKNSDNPGLSQFYREKLEAFGNDEYHPQNSPFSSYFFEDTLSSNSNKETYSYIKLLPTLLNKKKSQNNIYNQGYIKENIPAIVILIGTSLTILYAYKCFYEK